MRNELIQIKENIRKYFNCFYVLVIFFVIFLIIIAIKSSLVSKMLSPDYPNQEVGISNILNGLSIFLIIVDVFLVISLLISIFFWIKLLKSAYALDLKGNEEYESEIKYLRTLNIFLIFFPFIFSIVYNVRVTKIIEMLDDDKNILDSENSSSNTENRTYNNYSNENKNVLTSKDVFLKKHEFNQPETSINKYELKKMNFKDLLKNNNENEKDVNKPSLNINHNLYYEEDIDNEFANLIEKLKNK